MSEQSKAVERVRDVLIVVGAVGVAVGVGMVYVPAGVIAAGIMMLAAGLAGVLR